MDCRGCGKPIVMGKDTAGKMIPIDMVPAIYQIFEPLPRGFRSVRRVPKDAFGVNHFATCTSANAFNKELRNKAVDAGAALNELNALIQVVAREAESVDVNDVQHLREFAAGLPNRASHLIRTVGRLIGAMQVETQIPAKGNDDGAAAV